MRSVDTWLVRLTRVLVYALVTSVGLLPVAPPGVAVGAGVGAAVGAFFGGSAAVAKVRLAALLSSVCALALSAWGIGEWLLASQRFAETLSPARALLVVSALQACVVTSAFALALRQLALRFRMFGIVEVALVASAGAQLVVGHRAGAINRPFELSDAIVAEGGDPTIAFLALGGAVVLLLVLLLLAEGRAFRALWHVAFLVLLSVLVADKLPVPDPPPSPLLQSQEGRSGKRGQRGQPGQGHGGGQRENNEELQFRDNYDSSGRTVPLAVVVMHDDYAPPGGMYYFRQAAFSHFNGRRLIQSSLSGVDLDLPSGFPTQEVTLPRVPNEDGQRLSVDTTVAMLSEHARPFALESLQKIVPVQNPDSARFRRVYRTTSLVANVELPDLLGRPVGAADWDASIRRHYLQSPEDRRYHELASEIVGELGEPLIDDPVARALSVVLFLGEKGTYSLRSGHAAAEDPTADFLFGDRVGYCVHFAHAAVYLMRALGIPARVGAGYVVDEAARQGGSSILITGQNAHAWPEFFVRGLGWVVADVAPAQTLDPAPGIPDPDLQRLLGELARGLRPLPMQGDNPFTPAVRWVRATVQGLRLAVLWGVPGLLLALYLLKTTRRIAPLISSNRQRARHVYRSQVDRLAGLATLRRHGESRQAFAARLAQGVPAFVDTTNVLVSATYGADGRSLSRARAAALQADFRGQLRASWPWWRRVVSALDPISFLRVR